MTLVILSSHVFVTTSCVKGESTSKITDRSPVSKKKLIEKDKVDPSASASSITSTETSITSTETSSNLTPSSNASVAFTFPEKDGTSAGWRKRVAGTCSESNKDVTIVLEQASSTVATVLASCNLGVFETYLDLSLVTGLISLKATQKDSANLTSPVALRTINKNGIGCGTSIVRARNIAGGLGGGSGTVTDPYVVCTTDQLKALSAATATQNFILGSDLYFQHGDSNGDGIVDGTDTDYRTGVGWVRSNFVGNVGTYFDGKGFSIEQLFANSSGSGVSLLGTIDYRVIRNLKLTNVDLTGTTAAGISSQAILSNVHLTGNLSSTTGGVGGLTGCSASHIINSSVTAEITSAGTAGGLAQCQAVIAFSKFEGTITAQGSIVGGLVGSNFSDILTKVVNSYAKGTIKGNQHVGGLVGTYGTIHNSFFIGRVEHIGATQSYFGGLNSFGASIYNSFAAVDVIAPNGSSVGNLKGGGGGTVSNTFYLASSTCTAATTCSVQGTSRTSIEEFFDRSQQPSSSWDFEDLSSDGYSNGWVKVGDSFKLWWEVETPYSTPFVGTGSASDPFLIQTADDFMRIASNPRWMDKSFRVTNNIDLSTSSGLKPIALEAFFYGIFDGGGFNLSNLTYSDNTMRGVGVIGVVAGAVVTRTHAQNINLTTDGFTGGVIGSQWYSSLSQLTATGTITGQSKMGGVVGTSRGAVSRLSANVTVIGTTDVGGVVGYQYLGISDCSARGNVTGTTSVGGLAGRQYYTDIRRNFVSGNVTGTNQVGGLVGHVNGGTYSNNFVTGNVTGNTATSNIGLFIGEPIIAPSSSGNAVYASAVCNNGGGGGCNTLHYSSTPATLNHFYNKANAPLSAWDWVTIWLEDAGQAAFPTLR